MIAINLMKIEPKHFPDGAQMLLDVDVHPVELSGKQHFDFYWKYENDEELVTIMFLAKHFRNLNPNCHMVLSMPYVPNARMDRVKSDKEVFTLKWFCEIINSLNFDTVVIFDPHSHVCEGLLNRLCVNEKRLNRILEKVVGVAVEKDDVIYFPDAGALKRYGELKVFKDFHKIYGQKNRDWKTGDIKGLTILSEEGDVKTLVEGKRVLMVDDIIAYGGTMYYSALELKKLGVTEIRAYASHTENSILDEEKGKFKKLLDNGTVSCLYTTDSLYKGKHEKIIIFDE